MKKYEKEYQQLFDESVSFTNDEFDGKYACMGYVIFLETKLHVLESRIEKYKNDDQIISKIF